MAILRIPALIDPHLHLLDSETQAWREVASVAFRSGYAGLQIMPDLNPPLTDKLDLAHYHHLGQRLAIPFYLTAAGTPNNIEALKQLRNVSAVKVWLGTGPEDLIVTTEETLRQILLSTDKVVMIHAEDEMSLLRNYQFGGKELSLAKHGDIFGRNAAIRATIKAITAAKETGRRVYLSHISTGEEVELVRQAKAKGWRVYAEVAPHHLFLTEDDLTRLDTLGKVNPPLRAKEDVRELWAAINDGTIDTIGSDTHAWLEKEKTGPYDQVPSGLPNLELTLPLLLTAVQEGKMTLSKFIALTSTNPAKIFSLPRPNRSLFVDMDNPHPYRLQLSDWQPYDVDQLVGWPVRQTIT